MPQRTLSEPEFDAIKAKILDAAPKGLKEDEFNRYIVPAMAQAIGEAENSAKPLDGSAIARFASGAWKNLNPMGIVSALSHPIATLGEIASSTSERSAAAVKALKEGRYGDAATNAVGAVPLVGPAMVSAGERIGEGDYAGGIGEAIGLIGSLESPRLVKGSASGVNSAATKVATSAGAQQALGAVTGASVGASVGHPYIGMALGTKYGGPVVRSVAEGVEGLTGGRKAVSKLTKAMTDLEFARQEVEAGRLSPAVLKALERQAEKAAQKPTAGIKPSPQTAPTAPPTAAEVPAVAAAEPVIRMGPDGKLVGRPGGNPDLPDQRALNEAAIAQRRAGQVQQVAPAIETPTPTEPKLTLTAEEARIGMQLLKAGKTADEALAHILALRDAKAGAFSALPNDAEMKAQLTVRKLTGKWAGDSAPKGWTVALPEKP